MSDFPKQHPDKLQIAEQQGYEEAIKRMRQQIKSDSIKIKLTADYLWGFNLTEPNYKDFTKTVKFEIMDLFDSILNDIECS